MHRSFLRLVTPAAQGLARPARLAPARVTTATRGFAKKGLEVPPQYPHLGSSLDDPTRGYSAETAVNNLLYNMPDKPRARSTRHVLVALMTNESGVLSRLSGVLAGRGFNIDSLVVAGTEVPGLSRSTIVLNANEREVEQARRQLEDMVQVWAVVHFGDSNTNGNIIERELLLAKISCAHMGVSSMKLESHLKRQALLELVKLFKGRVVDVADEVVTVELTAKSSRIDAFISLIRPFGITEASRTGSLAMLRGNLTGFNDQAEEVEEASAVDVSALPPG